MDILCDADHLEVFDKVDELGIWVTDGRAVARVALTTESHVGQVQAEEGHGGRCDGLESGAVE